MAVFLGRTDCRKEIAKIQKFLGLYNEHTDFILKKTYGNGWTDSTNKKTDGHGFKNRRLWPSLQGTSHEVTLLLLVALITQMNRISSHYCITPLQLVLAAVNCIAVLCIHRPFRHRRPPSSVCIVVIAVLCPACTVPNTPLLGGLQLALHLLVLYGDLHGACYIFASPCLVGRQGAPLSK